MRSIRKQNLSYITLNEIYSVPEMRALFHAVFGGMSISTSWKQVIASLAKNGSTFLDVGAGGGRLAEWIQGLGASVTAIEANKHMNEFCKFRLRDSDVHSLYGNFLTMRTGYKYDVIVMHQNVFLELVNECQHNRKKLWSAVRNHMHESGILVFDYLIDFHPVPAGEAGEIYSRFIAGLGDVRYAYRVHSCLEREANIELELYLNQNLAWAATLKFELPRLQAIIEEALHEGIEIHSIQPIDQFTFFPARPVLCTGRHRSERANLSPLP